MKVLMRNPDLAHRGQLPVLSGDAVIRNNDLSTWSLKVNGNDRRSQRFQPGWGVQILDEAGNQILSGPATKISTDVSGDNRKNTLTIAGVSDDVFLADSLVIPNPPAGATATADLWKATGKAETVMRRLVNEQIGPASPADYRIPRLVVLPDLGRGRDVSVGERFTNLLDVLQAQATAGELQFRLRQNKQTLEFRIFVRRDLSKAVRLTRHNGAVGAYKSEREAPEATEIIVGGAGAGSTRKLWREPSPAGEWGRRVTKFLDRQSTSDSNELRQAAQTELKDKGEQASVTFEATDIPRLRYGRDFIVGDKITVDLDGSPIRDTLQIVELSWDSKGRTAKMQVGPTADDSKMNPANGVVLKLYKDIWAQVRRAQTR